MKVVQESAEIEEVIKKSRFLAFIKPTSTEREALEWLDSLNHQYPDASHLVYAYRIKTTDGWICRFNDAGEPSGTAGKPIFQHLEGKQIRNTTLAIIRYFGGVKLGAGGLTRAYSQTAKLVIDKAHLTDYIELTEKKLTIPYHQLQLLEYHLKKLDGSIIQQNFAEDIQLTIQLPSSALSTLLSAINLT